MNNEIKILIGGDLFPTPVNYELFSNGNAKEIFGEEVCNLFDDSDFSICNLEGCLTDDISTVKLKDGPNIRAPKSCILAIKKLGVDCLCLANNHVTDYGLEGYRETIQTLRAFDFSYFGAGERKSDIVNYYTKIIRNKTITFYAVSETIENVPTDKSPGVNIYDEYSTCKEIMDLKRKSDFLVVLYHGGIENFRFVTDTIRTRFHRMADNGADIIISQHTHTIGQEEYYNNSYLLYGQGNFCFHLTRKAYEWNSQALLLSLRFSEEGYTVQKHLVNRNDPVIQYDKDQNFTSFIERSNRLKNNEKFDTEFKQYADEKIIPYLHAFRGKNFEDKIMRRILPKKYYAKYIRKRFSTRHILKILVALQSEEFREISTQGLLNMLEDNLKTGDKNA